MTDFMIFIWILGALFTLGWMIRTIEASHWKGIVLGIITAAILSIIIWPLILGNYVGSK